MDRGASHHHLRDDDDPEAAAVQVPQGDLCEAGGVGEWGCRYRAVGIRREVRWDGQPQWFALCLGHLTYPSRDEPVMAAQAMTAIPPRASGPVVAPDGIRSLVN
jgi:hypothetical protein